MKKNTQKYILVDMSWWLSSSRKRGIGVYLIALFTYFFEWQGNIPIWFFPKLSKLVETDFRNTMRFGEIACKNEKKYDTFSTLSGLLIQSCQISYAISGSPFERPWSLLTDVDELALQNIPLKIVVHDLLPLKFASKIIHTWSKNDQLHYAFQVSLLNRVETILVTGIEARSHVLQFFPRFEKKISIIEFGEKINWFKIPANVRTMPTLVSKPYALSISGGEWRKNLKGTLQLFSLKFPNNWMLVVVCKLGKIEKLKYQALAISYGLLNRVVWAGEVSESTKWRYISKARVLLSITYGEGLNLPVLEAKSVGVPSIIISDMKEIYSSPLGQPANIGKFKI